MKKLLITFAIGAITFLSLESCALGAYAESEIPINDDESLIIRLGTPYYYEGSILYYMYDGWYYYPYTLGGRHYYYRYAKPRPLPRHSHHATPRRHDRPNTHNSWHGRPNVGHGHTQPHHHQHHGNMRPPKRR